MRNISSKSPARVITQSSSCVWPLPPPVPSRCAFATGAGGSSTGGDYGNLSSRDSNQGQGQSHNFGWIGLLGLAGSAGLARHNRTKETITNYTNEGAR